MTTAFWVLSDPLTTGTSPPPPPRAWEVQELSSRPLHITREIQCQPFAIRVPCFYITVKKVNTSYGRRFRHLRRQYVVYFYDLILPEPTCLFETIYFRKQENMRTQPITKPELAMNTDYNIIDDNIKHWHTRRLYPRRKIVKLNVPLYGICGCCEVLSGCLLDGQS